MNIRELLDNHSKKHTVAVPCGVVDEDGQSDIYHCTLTMTGTWLGLPDNWDWRTVVTGRGEYVGSLAKRIGKWLYQEHGVKLSSDDMGRIGSIIGDNCPRQGTYTIDYTQDLDWDAGDYGDYRSCYWFPSYQGARLALQSEGHYAIRTYDGLGHGVGRAWIYITNDDTMLIWNAYGPLSLTALVRIVCRDLDLSYKRVDTDASNGVWINADGFVVGEDEKITHTESAYIRLAAEDYLACVNCKDVIDLGSGCYHTTADGTIVCDYCAESDYFVCRNCEKLLSNNDLGPAIRVLHSNRCYYDEQYCLECVGIMATECNDCGEFWMDGMVTDVDGTNEEEKTVCHDCLSADYTRCDDCEGYHPDDAIVDTDWGGELCPDCLEKHQCAGCDELVEDLQCYERSKSKSELYCDDCKAGRKVVDSDLAFCTT